MTKTRAFSKLTESLGVENSGGYKFDKQKLIRDNYYMMLDKTAQMFDYDGLPPTLPKVALEFLLQTEGSAVIWNPTSKYTPVGYGMSFNFFELRERRRQENAGEVDALVTKVPIYAFSTNLAEAPDPYHEPYKVVITNPGFSPSISETLELNKDCVLIRNDTYMRGLHYLHKKYAYLLAEAEVSLRSTLICLRDQLTFVAKTEPQRAAVAQYIKDRENGVPGSILAPDLGTPLEAIQADGRTNSVELAVNGRQAIYAAWYNEIGLNPSFSLKREYTSAQEIDTNTDLLVPSVDDMLECRQIACESINAMFGTSIVVRKSSAWAIKEEQINNALMAEAAQAEGLVTKDDEQGGDEDDSVQSGDSDAS